MNRTLSRILEEHEETNSQSQTEFNERTQNTDVNYCDTGDEDDITTNATLLTSVSEYSNNDARVIALTNFKFEEFIEHWKIVKTTALISDKRGKHGKHTEMDRFF